MRHLNNVRATYYPDGQIKSEHYTIRLSPQEPPNGDIRKLGELDKVTADGFHQVYHRSGDDVGPLDGRPRYMLENPALIEYDEEGNVTTERYFYFGEEFFVDRQSKRLEVSAANEEELAIALEEYTDKNSKSYDPVFDRKIRAAAPHWFAD